MHSKVSLLLLVFLSGSFIAASSSGTTQASDFTLVDIDGEEFQLSQQRGKVIIINFFYIDCYYCKLEMPHLRALYDEYSPDQFALISITVDPYNLDTNERLHDFAQQYHMEWRVARDTTNVADKYGVSPTPHTVIVDSEGVVRYNHVGLTGEETFRSEIDVLLSEPENGNPDSDPNPEQPGFPFTLIALIVGGIILFLVVGIVIAGYLLDWSEPSKKRPRKGKH